MRSPFRPSVPTSSSRASRTAPVRFRRCPASRRSSCCGPTDDREVFLVYTRWRSQEDFENWLNGQAFQQGHAGHAKGGPVGTGQRAVVVRRRAARGRARAALADGCVEPRSLRRRDRTRSRSRAAHRPRRPVRDHPRRRARRRHAGVRAAHADAARADGAERDARRRRLRRAGRRSDRLTFGQHDARARAVASALRRLGVGVGDRVALCSANNPDWVVTFWACAAARRGRRAAERVVEGRGARVRARRLRGEGADLRRAPAGGDRRPACADPDRRARVRDRRRARRRVARPASPAGRSRSSPTVRPISTKRRSTKTTCSRSSTRRARPAGRRARRSRTAR